MGIKFRFLIRLSILLSIVGSIFLSACTQSEVEKVASAENPDSLPTLEVYKTTNLISDSGITRYRIYTDKWDVYEKRQPTFWEFPKGIMFERFDETLHIDANFHSNYAKYLDKKQLWEFKGKVKVVNIKGEMFETEQLFWVQKSKLIYSDKTVKMTTADRIVIGKGFRSDETMTQSKMENIQAIIAVDEENME